MKVFSKIADGIEVALKWLLVWIGIWMASTFPILYLVITVESYPLISSSLHCILIAWMLLLACGTVADIAMRTSGRGAIFIPLQSLMARIVKTQLVAEIIASFRSTSSEISQITKEASSGINRILTVIARTSFLLIKIAFAVGLIALIVTTPWLWMLIILILLVIIALR